MLFTRLGFTAFGGPAAHVALMEDEVVERRRWMDRGHFLDAVAAVNFVPGPNSTELAIHVGQLRAGFAGLVVAGVCFITPAVLIILPIAWAYVTYGALPQVQPALRTIGAAIVAVVAVATVRFARAAVRDAFTVTLCAACAVGAVLLMRFTPLQPEVLVLAFAAAAGALWYAKPRAAGARTLALVPASWLGLVSLDPGPFARMALFFLKVGATLFGSGYVLISYLQSGLVDDYRWLTQRQLLDAIAVGQFTPGPLLTTATFVGFLLGHGTFGGGNVGGVVGAIVATVAGAGFVDIRSELVGNRVVAPALRFVRDRLDAGRDDGPRTLGLAARAMLSQAEVLWERGLLDYLLLEARKPDRLPERTP